MTAVLEDLSLAGLAGDLAPDCDVRGCLPLEAAAICWWSEPCCDGAEAANLLCQPHREIAQSVSARGGTWTCDLCGATRRIERIEALR